MKKVPSQSGKLQERAFSIFTTFVISHSCDFLFSLTHFLTFFLWIFLLKQKDFLEDCLVLNFLLFINITWTNRLPVCMVASEYMKMWVPLFSHRVLFCLYFRFWRKTLFTTGRKENRIIWKVLQITFSQTLVHLRSRSWNSWLQKCFTKK